ncbi:putative aldouronate transport system substrate-binding protein [Paenibacillus sacheonensis]|nr:putative aldouronate transport system substrate-binding protein [Paenibacillus sacheonensis]
MEPVTLKLVLPGTEPANYKSVKEAVEKKLLEDGQNTKLDITYIDWPDLDQKTKIMLAAGENADLMYDAPWLHMNQMINSDFYTDISDLLEQYGPNVVKARSQQIWDANTFNGKTMGVPLSIFTIQGHSVNIRKDVREALNLPLVQSYEDLENYLYKAHEKYPNLTLGPGASDLSYTWVNWQLRDDTSLNIRPTQALNSSVVLYYKGNDGKAYNLFDEMEPGVWSKIEDARKLYTDKVIAQDVLTSKNIGRDTIVKNITMAAPQNVFGPIINKEELGKTIPGGELEAVRFFDLTPGKNISNFMVDNFVVIPKVSKNKERAMMFLDWANQEGNYMLVEHGVKGKDWEETGEKRFKQLVPNQDQNGGGLGSFSLVWNPVMEYTIDTTDEETMKYESFIRDANNFTADILTGFTFDATKVKNEIAQFSSIQGKYYAGIFNGAIDPDKYWETFKSEGAAPLKKIQTELQAQIDAFLKK